MGASERSSKWQKAILASKPQWKPSVFASVGIRTLRHGFQHPEKEQGRRGSEGYMAKTRSSCWRQGACQQQEQSRGALEQSGASTEKSENCQCWWVDVIHSPGRGKRNKATGLCGFMVYHPMDCGWGKKV